MSSNGQKIAPSFSQAICHLPLHGRVFVQVDPAAGDETWRACQEREKAFWHREISRPDYRPDPVAHIAPCLAAWGVTKGFFRGKTVVEIGCGPFSFFAGFRDDDRKNLPGELLAVDPLMDFYQRFPVFALMPPDIVLLQAAGETLPLSSASVDIVVTCNALDHAASPLEFLRESRRILRPGGKILFAVHVVPAFLSCCKPILRKVDRTHPQHLSVTDLRILLEMSGFVHESLQAVSLLSEEKIPRGLGFWRKLFYLAGFCLIRTCYGSAVRGG